MNVKSDHCSKLSSLSNWKVEAWKIKSGLQQDSNLLPPRYRCDALPTELWSHTLGARSIYWVHIFPCSEVMWNIFEIIGHFRITSGLVFEASLGAHPFICKTISIHTQIKLIFMWMKIYFAYEKMSTKTRFENEVWGNSEMAYSYLYCGCRWTWRVIISVNCPT